MNAFALVPVYVPMVTPVPATDVSGVNGSFAINKILSQQTTVLGGHFSSEDIKSIGCRLFANKLNVIELKNKRTVDGIISGSYCIDYTTLLHEVVEDMIRMNVHERRKILETTNVVLVKCGNIISNDGIVALRIIQQLAKILPHVAPRVVLFGAIESVSAIYGKETMYPPVIQHSDPLIKTVHVQEEAMRGKNMVTNEELLNEEMARIAISSVRKNNNVLIACSTYKHCLHVASELRRSSCPSIVVLNSSKKIGVVAENCSTVYVAYDKTIVDMDLSKVTFNVVIDSGWEVKNGSLVPCSAATAKRRRSYCCNNGTCYRMYSQKIFESLNPTNLQPPTPTESTVALVVKSSLRLETIFPESKAEEIERVVNKAVDLFMITSMKMQIFGHVLTITERGKKMIEAQRLGLSPMLGNLWCILSGNIVNKTRGVPVTLDEKMKYFTMAGLISSLQFSYPFYSHGQDTLDTSCTDWKDMWRNLLGNNSNNFKGVSINRCLRLLISHHNFTLEEMKTEYEENSGLIFDYIERCKNMIRDQVGITYKDEICRLSANGTYCSPDFNTSLTLLACFTQNFFKKIVHIPPLAGKEIKRFIWCN